MKKGYLTLLFTCILIPYYGQKTNVKTEKGGSIVVDFTENIYGVTINNNKTYKNYFFAKKKGYSTQIFKIDSIQKLNRPEYFVKLLPLQNIDNSIVNKHIVFEGLKDPMKIVNLYDLTTFSVIELSSLEFKNVIRDKLFKYKFNIKQDEDVFKQKKIKADYILTGEIIHIDFSPKDTPGFALEIVISWTFYNTKTEQPELKIITGGHSNTRTKNTKDEFKQVLDDATSGIITNQKVIELLSSETTGNIQNQSKYTLINKKNKLTQPNLAVNIKKASVKIETENTTPSYAYLISSDGFCLTHYHTIKDQLELFGNVENGPSLPIKIISFNADSDLALCQLLGKGYSYLSIDTANAKGNEIYAYPINDSAVIAKGKFTNIYLINELLIYETTLTTSTKESILFNQDGQLVASFFINSKGNKPEAISVKSILNMLGIGYKEEEGN